MKRYEVLVKATAEVFTYVQVTADSKDEARHLAVARAEGSNPDWTIGTPTSIETEDVDEIRGVGQTKTGPFLSWESKRPRRF
jgi:hypothetical protein